MPALLCRSPWPFTTVATPLHPLKVGAQASHPSPPRLPQLTLQLPPLCPLTPTRQVITGDYKPTAEAICKQIGVFAEHESLTGKSLSGTDFFAMSAAQQRDALAGHGGRCFSGAQPNHKLAIVQRLQEMGEIVAMTGDGVPLPLTLTLTLT